MKWFQSDFRSGCCSVYRDITAKQVLEMEILKRIENHANHVFKTDGNTYRDVYPGFLYTIDYEKQVVGYRERILGI